MFFSTSVEPRTVRAYCTQNDRPIESTITQNTTCSLRCSPNSAREVPSISIAIRIAGKVLWMSAARMMTQSTEPPA